MAHDSETSYEDRSSAVLCAPTSSLPMVNPEDNVDPSVKLSNAHRPKVDIEEHDFKSYVVKVDLPGIKKDKLHLNVGEHGRCLFIWIGKKAEPTLGPEDGKEPSAPSKDLTLDGMSPSAQTTEESVTPKNIRYILSERTFLKNPNLSARIKVKLPSAVDGSKVKAVLEDGVLTVRLPKARDNSVSVNIS